MMAAEPYLSACLEVLYRATISARSLGWDGEKTGLSAADSQRLVALMEAVHNIPLLLRRWEDCDEAMLRGFLETFDTKWNGGLLAAYEQALGSR